MTPSKTMARPRLSKVAPCDDCIAQAQQSGRTGKTELCQTCVQRIGPRPYKSRSMMVRSTPLPCSSTQLLLSKPARSERKKATFAPSASAFDPDIAVAVRASIASDIEAWTRGILRAINSRNFADPALDLAVEDSFYASDMDYFPATIVCHLPVSKAISIVHADGVFHLGLA